MRISDWSSDVCSSDLECIKNPRYQCSIVVRPHPQRIARLVMQAGAGQRQLDMAQIAATVTATDALIGQQLGGKRLLTTCQRRRWRTPQRGDGDRKSVV